MWRWRAGGGCIGVSITLKPLPYQFDFLRRGKTKRRLSGSICYIGGGVYLSDYGRGGEVGRSRAGTLGSEVLEVIRVEAEEAAWEADEGLEVLDAKPRHDEFKPGHDEKKWDELIQRQDGVKVRQLTFVEVVPSRHSKHVVPTIRKIYTKLRYIGLSVLRVRPDRARELTSVHAQVGRRQKCRQNLHGWR